MIKTLWSSILYTVKSILVTWVRYVGALSRYPLYFFFIPFPFIFTWIAFDSMGLSRFPLWVDQLYFVYLLVVWLFAMGSWALAAVYIYLPIGTR